MNRALRLSAFLFSLCLAACSTSTGDDDTPPAMAEFEVANLQPETGAVEVSVGNPIAVFFSRTIGSVRFTVRRASGEVLGQAFVSTDRRSATFRPVGNSWRSGATYDAYIEATSLGDDIEAHTRFTVAIAAGLPTGLVGRTWDLMAVDPPEVPGLAASLDAGPKVLITLLELNAATGEALFVVRRGPPESDHTGGVPVSVDDPTTWILTGTFNGNRVTIDEPGFFGIASYDAEITLLFDAGANEIEEWRYEGSFAIEHLMDGACEQLSLGCNEDGVLDMVFGGSGRANPIGTVPFFFEPEHGSVGLESTGIDLQWSNRVEASDLNLRFEILDQEGLPTGPAQDLAFVPTIGSTDKVSVASPAPFPSDQRIRLWAEHPSFDPPSHWVTFSTAP